MSAPNAVCRGGCGRMGPRDHHGWAWADDRGEVRADAAGYWPWCAACLAARKSRTLEERARRVADICLHRSVLAGRECPGTDEPLEQWCHNCLTYRRALRELVEATAGGTNPEPA